LIPGVSVSATNTQTGVVKSAVSNETGTYNFASLQPKCIRPGVRHGFVLVRSVAD
jgi:hypothetical protein